MVTGSYKNDFGQQTNLEKGDIIEKINGRSIKNVTQYLLPIKWASNYPTQLRHISGKLLRTNDSLITINYKRDRKSGDLVTHISGLGVYYPDGKPTQRIGIIPDIEVRPHNPRNS